MKKMVALLTLLTVLTACGGGGGRPSTEDLAKALKDKDNAAGKAFGASGVDDKVIDCIAKAFHDSDLSDKTLQAIVDGDEDYEGSKDDEKVLSDSEFTGAISKCITG